MNTSVLAVDLDGPGTAGHGSTDLVLLEGIRQLGSAIAGTSDTRGCVSILQIDPTTQQLAAIHYLDPTDMGSVSTAMAVGDILSTTRTGAPYTSSPLDATAPSGSPDIVIANTGDSTLTFYLQLVPATYGAGGYTPPVFTSAKVDMSLFVPGTQPGDIDGVAIGDLNGDFANDLVVVGQLSRYLSPSFFTTRTRPPRAHCCRSRAGCCRSAWPRCST